MKMTPNTTFDRIMANPQRKKVFEQGYREFLLSELRTALSQRDDNAVSELLTALLPNHQVAMVEGSSKGEMTLRNFLQVMNQLGYEVTATKRSGHNMRPTHLLPAKASSPARAAGPEALAGSPRGTR